MSGEFGDDGFEEIRGGGARGGELRFQFVDQGHQLIHFGHDTALFGEGREWYQEVPNQRKVKIPLRDTLASRTMRSAAISSGTNFLEIIAARPDRAAALFSPHRGQQHLSRMACRRACFRRRCPYDIYAGRQADPEVLFGGIHDSFLCAERL